MISKSLVRASISVSLLAVAVYIIPYGADSIENECEMTRMRPFFVDVATESQYHVLRYLEAGVPHENKNALLFVPGNGGSYRQVRSLASAVHSFVDVFALDFAEEFAAFDGRLLQRQVEFTQKTLQSLSREYQDVLLLGASIGGIVAALAAPQRHDILTLATPHIRHPLAVDFSTLDLYSHYKETRHRNKILSISGGPRDWQVPDWLAAYAADPGKQDFIHLKVHSIVPSVPSTDHQCILWCNQLIRHLGTMIKDWPDSSYWSSTHRNNSTLSYHAANKVRSLASVWPFLSTVPAAAFSQLNLWLLPKAPALFLVTQEQNLTILFGILCLATLFQEKFALYTSVPALLLNIALLLLLRELRAAAPRPSLTSVHFRSLVFIISLFFLYCVPHPFFATLPASILISDGSDLYFVVSLLLIPSLIAICTAKGSLPPAALYTHLITAAPFLHSLLAPNVRAPRCLRFLLNVSAALTGDNPSALLSFSFIWSVSLLFVFFFSSSDTSMSTEGSKFAAPSKRSPAYELLDKENEEAFAFMKERSAKAR